MAALAAASDSTPWVCPEVSCGGLVALPDTHALPLEMGTSVDWRTLVAGVVRAEVLPGVLLLAGREAVLVDTRAAAATARLWVVRASNADACGPVDSCGGRALGTGILLVGPAAPEAPVDAAASPGVDAKGACCCDVLDPAETGAGEPLPGWLTLPLLPCLAGNAERLTSW